MRRSERTPNPTRDIPLLIRMTRGLDAVPRSDILKPSPIRRLLHFFQSRLDIPHASYSLVMTMIPIHFHILIRRPRDHWDPCFVRPIDRAPYTSGIREEARHINNAPLEPFIHPQIRLLIPMRSRYVRERSY